MLPLRGERRIYEIVPDGYEDSCYCENSSRGVKQTTEAANPAKAKNDGRLNPSLEKKQETLRNELNARNKQDASTKGKRCYSAKAARAR